MYKIFFLGVVFFNSWCCSIAQTKKKVVDSCHTSLYWVDIKKSNLVSKDSVRVIGSIIIVSNELQKPVYYAAISFNGKKYQLDKDGKIDITVKNGSYVLKAFSGGSYPCLTEKIQCNGGVIIHIKFYLKGIVYID